MSQERKHTDDVTYPSPHTRQNEKLTEDKIADKMPPQDEHRNIKEEPGNKKSQDNTAKFSSGNKFYFSTERHNPDTASRDPAFPSSDRSDGSASERKNTHPTSDESAPSSSEKVGSSDPKRTVPPSPRN